MLPHSAPEKPLANKKSKKPVQVASIWPNKGKTVNLFVGKEIDFTEKIREFKEKNPGTLGSFQTTSLDALELYADIANTIRTEVLKLEKECADKLNGSNSPTSNGSDGLGIPATPVAVA